MKQLYTKWGEALQAQMQENEEVSVLEEYPRPTMIRDSYYNLNGWWDYAITDQTAGGEPPLAYEGKILVPFSPEAALSGVGRQVQPDEYLWYHKTLPFEKAKIKTDMRLLLHFGAVDQTARLYVDGKEALEHLGGYLPFTLDLTPYARESRADTLDLVVRVIDVSDTSYHARGKQKLQRGGMYYTAQSGIWQTVWMEYVPAMAIRQVEVQTDMDRGQVRFLIDAQQMVDGRSENELHEKSKNYKNNTTSASVPVDIKIFASSYAQPNLVTPSAKIQEISGRPVVAAVHDQVGIREKSQDSDNSDLFHLSLADILLTIPEDCIRLWTPETPYLYDYEITVRNADNTKEDSIYGYFALRSFTKETDGDGILRICLNHQPIFMEGVLDQGYWPDGLLTPPADAAYIFDILGMKETGFRMIRKHIKIESERFYFHCDRLGMIVWQDMVNGGSAYKDWYVTYLATALSFLQIRSKDSHKKLLSRDDQAGCMEWKQEMLATIGLLKPHPCISTWVIFNEGWGQFSTNEMVALAREADPTRLIDAASGWYDQGSGDMNSFHNYFFPLVIPRDKKKARRVAVLSEYGGYSYGIPEHSTTEDIYGYGTYKDTESLREAYQKRRHEAMALIADGLCASVYTQVSDIEDEVNGIYTYDRKIKKI